MPLPRAWPASSMTHPGNSCTTSRPPGQQTRPAALLSLPIPAGSPPWCAADGLSAPEEEWAPAVIAPILTYCRALAAPTRGPLVIVVALPANARGPFIIIVAAVPRISALAREQLVLRVDDPAALVDAEAFRDCAPALGFAGFGIHGLAREVPLRIGRWRSERGLRRDMGPRRLHHRLEDRDGNAASCGAAAQRSSLAHSVVVAKPDRNSDIVGKAHEPGIILSI